MTVETTVVKSGPYNGNGSTTIFNYSFKISHEDEIQVIKTSVAGVETVLTKTTDYVVSGVGSASGSVTLTSAPVTGEKVTIVLNMDFLQETDYDNVSNFYLQTIEASLDKLTRQDLELRQDLSACIRFPDSDPSGLSHTIPTATARADKYLGFDESGNVAVGTVSQGPAGPTGPAGAGVPAAGTAGQLLAKVNATDFNTGWINNPVPAGGTAGQYLSKVNSTDFNTQWSGPPLAVTSVAEITTTSGTSIEATGLPADVQRIVLHFRFVSLDADTALLIQLGTSADGFLTAVYDSYSRQIAGGSSTPVNYTAGFGVNHNAANRRYTGMVTLERTTTSGNTWTVSGLLNDDVGPLSFLMFGHKGLSSNLDRVRLIGANGTAAFDAGVLGITYWS